MARLIRTLIAIPLFIAAAVLTASPANAMINTGGGGSTCSTGTVLTVRYASGYTESFICIGGDWYDYSVEPPPPPPCCISLGEKVPEPEPPPPPPAPEP